MKAFMDKDFLLNNQMSQLLYDTYAKNLPIIDYHCHINPNEIAKDYQFRSITEAWLGGDHYKWRLMRANGVDEMLVTGNADDRDKFRAFAACLPKAVGNPIYHWAHMELRQYFGYQGVLNETTADQVFDLCNETLKTLRVRDIIRKSRVEMICTTDDPCDDLAAHKEIRGDAGFETKVLPGWRPDKAVNIHKEGFREYIAGLADIAGTPITDMSSLLEALKKRLDVFEAAGCRVSDHGLDYVPFAPGKEKEAEQALSAALAGNAVSPEMAEAYQFEVLKRLGREYARRSWIMQLHYGALRNNNSSMFAKIGPDTGYDAIGHAGDPSRIAGFLDSLNRDGNLPKTVLYSLNPNDNTMLTSIMGCFQKDCPGKLQHGSAWWFNDTKTGMEVQLKNLAEQSLLGNFIGMLTDSRSFLSYARHDYFRRILCNLVGGWIEAGEMPNDMEMAGRLIEAVSYGNIVEYLKP
ncbi:MAG TPA: glucuronate isomerase [Ruminococcaceae bacterium]|nr:glucuronate isomerase [Oscillospiraceae bacterium]